ncbi:hypothetical protein ACNOYE_29235 [Nannocystaceae bacterium ST9]
MPRDRRLLAPTLLLVACVPSSRAESEPIPAPAPIAAALEPTREPDETSSDAAPLEPEPPAIAEPMVADSKLVARSIVDPGVQPGLLEFTQELADPGALWVGKLEGNGGRDVLIFVPPGADDHEEFEFVYHFHGTYSEHVERPAEGLDKQQWVGWDRLAQTIDAARELQALEGHGRNVALIYPFSAGKRIEPTHKGWSNDMYDRMWMLPLDPPDPDYRDSFVKLHGEVVAILRDEFGAHPSKLEGPVLAEGHSAGGIALRNVALAGTDLVGEYLFLDAGFKSWADGCWQAIQAATSPARVTMVITDRGIADPLAGRDPWCTELERDAALWSDRQSWCETRMDRKPSGSESTCAELAEFAEEWKDYDDWCQEMKTDMQNVAGVAVVRTKVVHGDQPRRFAGGLGLPADRD